MALDHRGGARIVALDISKAFDKVWHNGLINKLKLHGISGKLFEIISDFLANHQISVVHEEQSTPVHNMNAGVPHGVCVGSNIVLVIYQ